MELENANKANTRGPQMNKTHQIFGETIPLKMLSLLADTPWKPSGYDALLDKSGTGIR